MNIVNINGRTIVSNGSISVVNGKIMIDGKDQTPDSKNIDIKIEGNVDELKVDYCNRLTVEGVTNNVTTSSGDVNVNHNVGGSINTSSGDVECGDVKGNVRTSSGDVKAREISGSVNTMSGDIDKSFRLWKKF
jgi:autotransporter translocation and assembly factor TamB